MNDSSTISIERTQFSKRLVAVLLSSRGLAPSPTLLAREFNHFFSGKAVTVHAARKWLLGEAIPTQDKLQALAHWLDVSVDWLRFGGEGNADAPAVSGGQSRQAPGSNMDALLRLYMALPHRDRMVAKQFVTMLARQSRQTVHQENPLSEKITLP